MSQPKPYRRKYDFSDAGGAQPPGGPLDGELDDVGLTLSQVLRNLALIQRDDTALRNGIVGIDALDSRVLGLISGGTFSIAGTWATATVYPAGAFFSDDEAIYLTMEVHTSTSIVDDLAAGYIVKVLQNEQGTRLRDDFTGNGVQTAFTLTQSPARPSDVEVYVEGLLVPSDDYAQTGATVTFDVAPTNGDVISIFSITWATTPPIQTLIDAVGDRNAEISAATQFIEDVGLSGGSALVGTSRDNTVEKELTWARAAAPASINEFYDATNGAAAERMALEGALASGREVSFRGLLTLDQAIVMPAGAILSGEGASSYDHSRGRTCIVRGFAGAEPTIVMVADCQLRNLDFDGDALGTGDLVVVKGARIVIDNVSVRKAGGDNLRIGATNEHLNANGWRISGLRSYLAEGRGFYIHHTNDNTGETFPQGAPDVNAGTMIGGDFLRNKGDGFVIGNAIDNKFFGPFSQESEGRNFHFMEDARGNHLYGYYNEEKIGSPGSILAVGTRGNMLFGSQVASPSQIVDMDGRNYVQRNSPSIARAAHVGDFNIIADPNPGPNSIGDGSGGFLNLFDSGFNLAAQIYAMATGVGSQCKGVATAKVTENIPIDVFEWMDGTGINILSGGLRVGGSQVVGARQAGIDNAAGGTEITTINSILAAMRTHGMIAT